MERAQEATGRPQLQLGGLRSSSRASEAVGRDSDAVGRASKADGRAATAAGG